MSVSNTWKTSFPQGLPSPRHDVATTMLHCENSVLGVMRSVMFSPHKVFSMMAEKYNFSLTWRKVFGKSATCCLVRSKHVIICFSFFLATSDWRCDIH